MSEYRELVAEHHLSDDTDGLVAAMIIDGEWTSRGARELVRLASDYGTFMLKEALALAEAARIEDGSLGF